MIQTAAAGLHSVGRESTGWKLHQSHQIWILSNLFGNSMKDFIRKEAKAGTKQELVQAREVWQDWPNISVTELLQA